jgi:hypothetical protein
MNWMLAGQTKILTKVKKRELFYAGLKSCPGDMVSFKINGFYWILLQGETSNFYLNIWVQY